MYDDDSDVHRVENDATAVILPMWFLAIVILVAAAAAAAINCTHTSHLWSDRFATQRLVIHI